MASSSVVSRAITLFLGGDVMIGRGIDQILSHTSSPELHESSASSAREYVTRAEALHGAILRPVSLDYIWGAALNEFERVRPALRIVNLETAVTTCDEYCESQDTHFRLHPNNVPTLSAVGADCCSIANDHALDFGREGLEDTLEALRGAGIRTVGAGESADEALAPACFRLSKDSRVLVFGCAAPDAGIPVEWAATQQRSGIGVLDDFLPHSLDELARRVREVKRPGDIVVLSMHWGGNWSYDVPAEHRRVAHELIDAAGVDILHGHSSHHPKGFEIYKGKLVLYGCGDLIDDFESDAEHAAYRPGLGLMYFPVIDAQDGRLMRLMMTPISRRRLRIKRADPHETHWLCELLNREGEPFGTRASLQTDGTLVLQT